MRRILARPLRRTVLALGVAAGLIAAVPAAAQDGAGIVVEGLGRVAAVPDMATIRLGVVTRGEDAATAIAANSAQMTAVLALLEGEGIAPADIQTAQFSVQPLWADRYGSGEGDPRIAGYSVTNDLTVRVRDLDALGGLLDSVVTEGANTFRGLSFGLADPDPVLDEARRAAVADALARARLYAEAAGVPLGPILSISEPPAARVMPEMAMATDRAAVPIAAGETEITARVVMVFAIGP